MKWIVFTFLISSFLFSANGQTVVKATEQGWAGGVCCRSGTNYTATLLFAKEPTTISVDGVFLQNGGKMEATIVQVTPLTKETYYMIHFGTSHNQNEYPEMTKQKIEVTERRNFEGKALIVLIINGKPKDVIIEDFEQLKFLAYP